MEEREYMRGSKGVESEIETDKKRRWKLIGREQKEMRTRRVH